MTAYVAVLPDDGDDAMQPLLPALRSDLDASAKLPADPRRGLPHPQLVIGCLDLNVGATLPAEELIGRMPLVRARACVCLCACVCIQDEELDPHAMLSPLCAHAHTRTHTNKQAHTHGAHTYTHTHRELTQTQHTQHTQGNIVEPSDACHAPVCSAGQCGVPARIPVQCLRVALSPAHRRGTSAAAARRGHCSAAR